MICTLRDELMQRCQEITELEAALSSIKQQVPSVATKPYGHYFFTNVRPITSVYIVFSLMQNSTYRKSENIQNRNFTRLILF